MKVPEGYILKLALNDAAYVVTHEASGVGICYVSKKLGEKENANIDFIQKFNEDRYLELDDVPYRGVIFDERDPESNTHITLDQYSKVFSDTSLTFTVKCDEVRIEGECGEVDFESKNNELILEKLYLKDVYETSIQFWRGIAGEIHMDDVSLKKLVIDDSVSSKATIKLKNVRCDIRWPCEVVFGGYGVVNCDPSYIVNDTKFSHGIYKLNAPNGLFLNGIGSISSSNPDKTCELDSRNEIRIDCKGMSSNISFDFNASENSLLRGGNIVIGPIKGDFTFNIVKENIIMGDFYFDDGLSEYSKTKLYLKNFEANSKVFCSGNSIEIKDCEIKTDGKNGIFIKDSLLDKCNIVHNMGSLMLHNARIKGFVLFNNVYGENTLLWNQCKERNIMLGDCDLGKSGDTRIEYNGKESFSRSIVECEFQGKNNYLKFDDGDAEVKGCCIRNAYTLLDCCVVKNSEIEGACDLVKTAVEDSTITESSIKSVKRICSSLINDCEIENVSRIEGSFLDKENLKDVEVIENRETHLKDKSVYNKKMVVNPDKSVEIEL